MVNRYYVLEFDQNKYAVTIRQSEPLLRQYRDGWGSTKLAVEGLITLLLLFIGTGSIAV